jgi:hypothetical protein
MGLVSCPAYSTTFNLTALQVLSCHFVHEPVCKALGAA